ncbi:hypothetical protein HK413_07575 [Mucilaginibacter sp. S1162]|uniref:Histidinol phosphatase n=1 Tax=Mucilaginibacter humi TaxID=2732510 RepID=A0ABX1W1I5_9SPHI|nr:DUF6282 family protein [Mucilaginibacter humi]NNU34048.1 hypothetical protein [Mucilaginibacter humi]
MLKRAGLVFTGLLLANLACAQTSTDTNPLSGVIDFHCHTGPDVIARAISDIDLAKLAKKEGMRGIVLKNHYFMTAGRAQIAMQEVPGIEVFGGIVLNRSAGGINAEAVRRMAQFEGHRGKVVWLPTADAENAFEHAPGPRQFVSVVKDGKPVPEMAEVFQIIAKNNLVFETGHSSPAESLILIPAAKAAGVKNIVVTHAMLLGATLDQMKQMATMGAVIEFCFQPAGLPNAKDKEGIAKYANAIKSIGADHVIIDSDLGQKNNPLPPDGLRAFIATLKTNGLSEREIDLIARKNPARLLGLDIN